MWDKLKNIYEEDEKIRQRFKLIGDNLKALLMKEVENIASYLLHVDEMVNTVKGHGEPVEEVMIVNNVLRSLSLRFDSKVSMIEEMRDIEKLTNDELHGIFMTYEMSIEEKLSKREVSFKASKKGKNKVYEQSDRSNNEIDEKEAHVMRKLKKGSGKYQAKLPFKHFNCGRIGHFASKCL